LSRVVEKEGNTGAIFSGNGSIATDPDIDQLLHPNRFYARTADVVGDELLTGEERRHEDGRYLRSAPAARQMWLASDGGFARAVLSSLDLMRKRLPDHPRLRSLLDNAVEGAQRGSTLTNRMLAFARRQELKLETIDVPDLVRGMTELTVPMDMIFPTQSSRRGFSRRLLNQPRPGLSKGVAHRQGKALVVVGAHRLLPGVVTSHGALDLVSARLP